MNLVICGTMREVLAKLNELKAERQARMRARKAREEAQLQEAFERTQEE